MKQEKKSFCKDFDVYSTSEGAVCITYDTQRKILRALSEHPCTESELIEITGRSQPVISNQLSKMIKSKLITYEKNPCDSRIKYFYLNSTLILEKQAADTEAQESYQKALAAAKDHPELLFRLVLETMDIYFISHGVYVNNIIRRQGEELAKVRALPNKKASFNDTFTAHSEYLKAAGFGECILQSTEPMVIAYTNTMDVTKSIAQSYSMFFQGYFSVIISDYYNTDYDVSSVDIFGECNNRMKMTFVPSSTIKHLEH